MINALEIPHMEHLGLYVPSEMGTLSEKVGGGFKYVYFQPYLGEIICNYPFWLIFFRWVGSTTN